jgi:hypothetical protein
MARWVIVQCVAAIAAVLIAKSAARAEPIHLTCDGATLKADGMATEEEHPKSLTIDLPADTVTFDGQSLNILPPTPMDRGKDVLWFIAVPQPIRGVSRGSVNRITGEVSVTFTDGVLYSGTCKAARKLF